MKRSTWLALLPLVLVLLPDTSSAQQVKILTNDCHIDAVDPGIKLFVRVKMADGTSTFTNHNRVLFVHCAIFPSTPDFDLNFKDYSWAN
jgi:hypothetical protein